MVLVAIIAIARLAVGSGEIERVRSRVLDLGADDRRLGSRTCEPAPTEIHRRAKAAPRIARRGDACDRSVVDRIVVSNPQSQRGQGQRPSAGIGRIDQSIEVAFEGQRDTVEIRIVIHADGSERDVVAAVERVVGVDQLVINRLDRLGRIELITIEINVNDVPQLLLGRPCVDHRLWHNGLDRRTEIQVEPNASRDPAVECETCDIAKGKRTGAEDIDQIGIVRKGFGKPNDDFSLGIAQGDVGRGDQLIVTADEIQRRVGRRVATDSR